ncbi:hypothetical protein OA264_03425 [Alphaproteobacteria bacterium]|nr:hypothetical protein [Alphaproteobacteria bacterium]
MKLNWIFKYYIIAFTVIFFLVYHIENSEPFVNWSLYPEISEKKIKAMTKNKNCLELQELFNKEYKANYEINALGFYIRKDNLTIRGLNLLKYLKYQLKDIGCEIS